ncbi:MAG: hypothetical protein Q9167_000668 [Letrouitia subvulpina]
MPALYDTFLCQEPARQDPFSVINDPENRITLLRAYERSAKYFAQQNRIRAVERLQYEAALLHIEDRQWKHALKILVPLWQTISWRQGGWWLLLEGLDWALRECARATSDMETLITVEWELLSNRFLMSNELVSTSFAFVAAKGHAGEPLPAQLILMSQAQNSCAPIVISELLISFEGGLKPISILHHAAAAPESLEDEDTHTHQISLAKATGIADKYSSTHLSLTPLSGKLVGSSDLTFKAGAAKVFSLDTQPRDAGNASVASIVAKIKHEKFDTEIVFSEKDVKTHQYVWDDIAAGLLRKESGVIRKNSVEILPKPPKLQMQVPNMLKEYLTDESVALNVLVTNEEEVDVEIELEARFRGLPELQGLPEIRFRDSSDDSQRVSLSTLPIGKMSPLETRTLQVLFKATPTPAESVFQLKALYHLVSEPDTPVSKICTYNVIFDRPFEANYDFRPLIDPTPWPDYFKIEKLHSKSQDNGIAAGGLQQKWHSTVRIASFARDMLDLETLSLQPVDAHDDIICKITRSTEDHSEGTTISPNGIHESHFVIIAQKLDLDDREPTHLQLYLEVRWRRHSTDAASAVTYVAVPNLVLPFGEPRVLASAVLSQDEAEMIALDYTIENPSDHLLNFDLSLESSDDFAFSGPKAKLLQLLPLTRHTVSYILLPLTRGAWISPHFRVWDTHFHQTLKVHGTGELKTDKKGISIWVDAND